MKIHTRLALMSSAITAAAIVASPAQAQCTLGSATATCANTTTTDTLGPQVLGSFSDRTYVFTAGSIPYSFIVPNGVTVDGFGLGFVYTGSSNGDATIDNSGTISVDVGNTPSAGGSNAAVFVSSDNFTATYQGTGTVANNGTGNGVDIAITGTGDAVVNTSGSITAANGDGVFVTDVAGSTGVSVTTGAVTASGTGINVQSNSATGPVTIVTNGAVNATNGPWGILATSSGSGLVHVTNNAGVAVGAAGGPGISAANYGTGSVIVDGNGAITGGTGGVGNLWTNATGGGNITITGNGVVSGGATSGIYAAATGGNGNVSITRGGGSVTGQTGVTASAVGTGTVGVTTTGAGTTITATAGDGLTTTAVDGLTTINLAGAVNATGGDGIDASASGTGGLNITTAAVTANGGSGNAISTNATTGTTVITNNGALTASGGYSAIGATATTGAITANVNGNVTSGAANAIILNSSGAKVVNVSAGRTVDSTGGNDVTFNGGGTAAVNNSGTIGATNTGIAIGTGTATLTVTNNAGGVINGIIVSAGGADTFTNAGTFNTGGASNFGAGVDLLANNTGGIINFATGSSLTGLESLTNAGTLNVAGTLAAGGSTLSGAGTLNLAAGAAVTGLGATTLGGTTNAGAGSSLAGTGAFSNTGTLDTAGAFTLAGFTSLSNSGTMDLAPAVHTFPAAVFTNSGTILADEGATTITGQTSFANSGTIDLQDGVVGDVLTINSSFAGSGGSNLMLDVGDATADQLVISGAASGSTTIGANLVGTGILIPTGVLLVDAGTSSAGAFSLGAVTGNTSPLLDYGLEQRVADYYLVTTVNAAGFAPVPVTLIAGDIWYKSAEAVWAQNKLPSDGTNRMGIWGQIYAGREKDGGTDSQTINGVDYDVDNRLTTDHVGFQAGYGFPLGGMGSVGITAGLGWADVDGNASGYKTKSYNIGAYGTFGGPAGIYGSVLAKHDRFDIDMDNSLFEDASPDGRSNGIDGEVGYRFGAVSGPVFGVSAGLSHVRTKLDDFSLAGLEYDYDSVKSTRGRIGVRATGSGPISPFVDVRAYREFSGDGDIRLSDGVDTYRLNAEGRGTWARIEAGVGGPASGLAPMVSVWADFGDVKGFGGRGSFRF